MASGIAPLVSLLDSPPGSNLAEFAVTAIGQVCAREPRTIIITLRSALFSAPPVAPSPTSAFMSRAPSVEGYNAHLRCQTPQLAGDESGEGALVSGGAIQKLVGMLKPKGAAGRPVPLQTAQAVVAALNLLSYTHRGAEIACDAGLPAALAALLARCAPTGAGGQGDADSAEEAEEVAAVMCRLLTSIAMLGGRPAEAVVKAMAAEVRRGGGAAAAAGGRSGGSGGGIPPAAATPPQKGAGVSPVAAVASSAAAGAGSGMTP